MRILCLVSKAWSIAVICIIFSYFIIKDKHCIIHHHHFFILYIKLKNLPLFFDEMIPHLLLQNYSYKFLNITVL